MLPEYQDSITENVCITRKDNQSIFNIAQEESYSGQNGSPLDTEWAMGATAEMNTNNYFNLMTMHGGNPTELVGDTISLHLVSDNLFFDVVFHNYSGGYSGGRFSYTRTHIPNNLSNNENIIIKKINIEPAYPNPFNPITNISYTISENTHLSINIYDISGFNR